MRRTLVGLREAATTTLVATVIAVAALSAGCGEGRNPGFEPPANQLSFPSGVLLDPRVSSDPIGAIECADTSECCDPGDTDCDWICGDVGECLCTSDDACGSTELCGSAGYCRATARWMLVTNANSDRRHNAGSLLAIDLDGFWEAAFGDPGAILSAGASVDEARPCRRLAGQPQTVECLEEPYVRDQATIHFGNFPGPASAWDQYPYPADDEAMLLIPVRGDPSVTYVELSGGLSGSDDLHFECGSDSVDPRRCDDDHRLRFLRNDPDAARLAREPFRVLVSPQPDQPLAYVSHQGDPDFTVLSLVGLSASAEEEEKKIPAIVHQANLLIIPGASLTYQGGFGLAQRPCDVASGNAPSQTLDCARPLVYSAMRWTPQVQSITAITHTPLPDSDQECVGPDDLDKIGAIICDPQAEPVRRFDIGELSTAAVPLNPSRPILADVAFSRTGNELYVVQSNPGGLLRVDTSIGANGETLDVPGGQVEVCSQPTSLIIYDDGGNEYGLVTCYRSGEVFIVDLASLTVVGLSRAGIGPDALAVDLAREVVYVANSLDATISLIDMAPTSPTRFTQIARIGLQDPYVK